MVKEKIKQAEINIGMIGHVDHGKTSLVQALTGKWTDTHSEELKKGISIRLGYADATFYKCGKCKGAEAYSAKEKCGSCNTKCEELRKVSFVDAPGHETLMATMLSGATLMQGAVLVIAANEHCPQPRTAEHIMALSISGVKNIVVAQNKIDLVDKKQATENYKEIVKFLNEYGYRDSPIIPTAAHFGTNIDLLIEAIEKSIPTPKQEKGDKLKMYVVRSFDVNKPGTKPEDIKGGILGGSIMKGEINKGDEIEISPGLEKGKIITKAVELSVSDGRIDRAGPGGLIAVGTALDPSLAGNDQMRGQVIGTPNSLPEPTTDLVLEVHVLKRLINKKSSEIKVNDLLVLTVGTMTAVGNVVKKLADNKFQISLRNPTVIEKEQKVAINQREESGWRLTAYGINK